MTPDDADAEQANAVRPYTLTAGRTRGAVEVPIEAVVVRAALDTEPGWASSDPRVAVLAACDDHAQSVAELAAHTGLALGVTRVLVGDLVGEGWVRQQATLTDAMPEHERITLIERTLRGLREL